MDFVFFNDTATTEIYTLSLHDALPISAEQEPQQAAHPRQRHRLDQELPEDVLAARADGLAHADLAGQDRKSTRLNSSHANISYAVFCLKKKRTSSTSWSGVASRARRPC